MGVGIVGFGKLLEYLLEYHVLATCLTFVGLILGGVPILWVHLKGSVSKSPAGAWAAPRSPALRCCWRWAWVCPSAGQRGRGKGHESFGGQRGDQFLLGVIASATMVIPGYPAAWC